MTNNSNPVMKWVYLFVLALVWGSSFILMKRGIEHYTPNQVAAIRMFVSMLALLPVVFNKLKEIEQKNWKYVIGTGLLGNCIPAYLFTNAETGISSSMAGMLNSLTSVFTILVGFMFFGSRFTTRQITGVFIGLLGATFLIYLSTNDEQSSAPALGLLIVLACVGYAFSVNILKHKLSHLSSITVTGGALIVAGIPSCMYLFSTDFLERMPQPGGINSLVYVLILGLMGTAFSTLIFNKLIRIASPVFASSVTYLIPFTAAVWGIYDGETFTMLYVLALAIILSGIWLINYKPKQNKNAEQH